MRIPPLNHHFLWNVEKLMNDFSPPEYNGKIVDLSPLCREHLKIDECVGNNSFSYISGRELHIAPVCEFRGTDDIQLGSEIVFADEWDGKLQMHRGLKQILVGRTGRSGTPFYLCDNHNLVLEAWNLVKGYQPLLKLVHIDQHRDDAKFAGNMDNWLNESRICDYIDFAKSAEWIDKHHYSYTESVDFDGGVPENRDERFILNIDLDIFAPDVTHISTESKIQLIYDLLPQTELITIAVSPGFIASERALPLAELMITYL
jgi:hypothetical protein